MTSTHDDYFCICKLKRSHRSVSERPFSRMLYSGSRRRLWTASTSTHAYRKNKKVMMTMTDSMTLRLSFPTQKVSTRVTDHLRNLMLRPTKTLTSRSTRQKTLRTTLVKIVLEMHLHNQRVPHNKLFIRLTISDTESLMLHLIYFLCKSCEWLSSKMDSGTHGMDVERLYWVATLVLAKVLQNTDEIMFIVATCSRVFCAYWIIWKKNKKKPWKKMCIDLAYITYSFLKTTTYWILSKNIFSCATLATSIGELNCICGLY